jgi:pyrophosphatase PpaX
MSFNARPRAVLFDVDGTLVNTIPMIVAGLSESYKALADRPVSRNEVKATIGTPLSTCMNLYGCDAHPSTLDERIRFAMDRYIANADKIEIFDGVLSVVADLLSAGIPVGLVTSRNAEELEWISNQFPILWDVPVHVSASDVSNPKPHPDPVLLACAQLGVDPSDAIFIGDSVHDVHAGVSAGVTTVAVSYGSSTTEELLSGKPNLLLASPKSVCDWLQATFSLSTSCQTITNSILDLEIPPANLDVVEDALVKN